MVKVLYCSTLKTLSSKYVCRLATNVEGGAESEIASSLENLSFEAQEFKSGDSLSRLLTPVTSRSQLNEIISLLSENDINPNIFWEGDTIRLENNALSGLNKGVEFSILLPTATQRLASEIEAELGDEAQRVERAGVTAALARDVQALRADVLTTAPVNSAGVLGDWGERWETLGHLDSLLNDRRDEVEAIADRHGVGVDLVMGVAVEESKGDPAAISSAGAQGVMMLMPETAAELGVEDPLDFTQNVEGGARYLGQLLARYNGDTEIALAAYNWGLGNVDRTMQARGISTFADLRPYLPTETQNYVTRVLAYASDSEAVFPVMAVARTHSHLS